jgi:Methyltransferase domain
MKGAAIVGLASGSKMGMPAARFLSRVRKQLSPPLHISDEYVEWLSFANAGMLDRGNLYCFDFAIRNLPSDAPILEIGSFCGLSTNLITHYKEMHGVGSRLITCDKWEFEGSDDDLIAKSPGIKHSEYRAFVKDTFMRNARMFSRNDLPYTVEKLSDEFFEAWSQGETVQDVFGRDLKLGGPLSFCYIDGNHSYEFAKRDFQNCDAVLEKGGFILFDDSADESQWEVRRVITEIKARRDYEVVKRNPNYLVRKL